MKVTFLSQGLDNKENHPIGYELSYALQSMKYKKFFAFSAFLSTSGIKNLIDELQKFIDRGGTVQFNVGVDMHGTSLEALQTMLNFKIPTNIIHSPNSIVYHPKIYVLEGYEEFLIIVGSSNFTGSGLYQNIESSIKIEEVDRKKNGDKILKSIYSYFEDFMNSSSESSNPLTEELLNILKDNKIVLPEKINRKLSNEIASMLPISTTAKDAMNKIFKKISPTRPPKGYKRKIRTICLQHNQKDKTTSTVIHTNEIPHQSLWVETGRMTGASKNIFDLSMNGKDENGHKISGTITFFLQNPNDHTVKYENITIIYQQKKYYNCCILYGKSNKNWRIQLKGQTNTGEKFTDITRPQNGALGELCEKIMIFTKTKNPDEYIVEVVHTDEQEHLKSFSTTWGHSGNGIHGRLFGFTN